jgi:hypothetical protein
VRVWASVDRFRAYLSNRPAFRLVAEEGPLAAVVAILRCFFGGLLGVGFFGLFFFFSAGALAGAILVHWDTCFDRQVLILMGCYVGMVVVSFRGLCEGARAFFVSMAAAFAACLLMPVIIIEFVTRRITLFECPLDTFIEIARQSPRPFVALNLNSINPDWPSATVSN